jgi:hypothetical protein
VCDDFLLGNIVNGVMPNLQPTQRTELSNHPPSNLTIMYPSVKAAIQHQSTHTEFETVNNIYHPSLCKPNLVVLETTRIFKLAWSAVQLCVRVIQVSIWLIHVGLQVISLSLRVSALTQNLVVVATAKLSSETLCEGVDAAHSQPKVYVQLENQTTLSTTNRSRRSNKIHKGVSVVPQRILKIKKAVESINIKIGLINIRSLNQKSDAVHEMITDMHLNILAITESWLRDKWDDHLIINSVPRHYKFLRADRSKKKGGGIV